MSAPATPSRRGYAIALLLLALGGVVLLIAYGLTWADTQVPLLAGSNDALQQRDFTGRDLLPGAAISGWVALAATAGIIATRSWGRIVVAVIALLAGLMGAGAAIAFAVRSSEVVSGALAGLAGGAPVAPVQVHPAWLLALIGGLLVVAAAVTTVLHGRSWPSLGARYERPPGDRPAANAWDALDKGQDPTDDLVE